MSQWKKYRKWKNVSVQKSMIGFKIFLDKEELLTPKSNAFLMTSEKLATQVAKEWESQEKFLRPSTMRLTTFVNSAIDKVKEDYSLIVEDLLSYGETDLLCYKAESPKDLVELQNLHWDPILKWSAKDLGIRLRCFSGIKYQSQALKEIEKIRKILEKFDHFTLTAFSELVTISGSMLLALALYFNEVDVERAWHKSVLDEVWQASKWGYDEESTRVRKNKLDDFKFAFEFLSLLK